MKQKGITLVALVITIVILLILAGVVIGTVTGADGIFSKAKQSKDSYEITRLKEDISVTMTAKDSTKSIKENLETIKDVNVNQGADDVYYVQRDGYIASVYEDGDILEGKVDIWDGTSSEVPEIDKKLNWYIYTCAQFKFLEDFVNNGNVLTETQKSQVAQKGYNESDLTITNTTTVYLMNNLDLGARHENGELKSGTIWTPIGVGLKEEGTDIFNGTFEGNNYCIKGAYVKNPNYTGLFGYIDNEVRNLTIKDGYVEGEIYVGGIAGAVLNGATNCHNVNTTIKGMVGIGGIAGACNGKIEDCTNTGNSIAGSFGGMQGGIVGMINNQSIINCTNYGNIFGSYAQTAGIVGQAMGGTITNCANFGEITSVDGECIAGIAGVSTCEITNCINSGKVYGKNLTGGIAAQTANKAINYCINNGPITGQTHTGGIAGVIFGPITNCYNSGTITQVGGSGDLGGICGSSGQKCTAIVQNCYNTGTVIEKVNDAIGVGGIIGWISTTEATGTITNNYNVGEIKIEAENVTEVGGIVGRYATDTFTIDKNYYLLGKSNVELNEIGEAKSETDMKKSDFVTMLNTGLSEAIWEIRTEENNGFPVIKGLKHIDKK